MTEAKPGANLFLGALVARLFPQAVGHTEDWQEHEVRILFPSSGPAKDSIIDRVHVEHIPLILEAFQAEKATFSATAQSGAANTLTLQFTLVLSNVKLLYERPT